MKKHSLVILSLLLPLIFTSCLADYLNEKFGFTVPVSINYSSPFGNVPARKKVTPGTELTAQDLPKLYTKENEDENEFLGWFLDDNFSLPAYEGYIVNEDITLYAQWKYQPAKYSQNDTLYSLQFSLFNPDNGSYGFDEHIDPGLYFDSLQQALDYIEYYSGYEYIPEIPDLNNYYVDYSYEPAKTIYIIEKRYYKTHFDSANITYTNLYLPKIDNYTYNFYFTDYAPDLTQFTYTDGVNANLHMEDCPGLTTIPTEAFKECTWLKEIYLPSSITSIGNYAFADCTGLQTIIMPGPLTRLGTYAFSNCIALESIKIPVIDHYGNNDLSEGTFSGCSNLKTVYLPVVNHWSIGKNAFYDCVSLKTVYFGGSSKDNVSIISDGNDKFNAAYWICNASW